MKSSNLLWAAGVGLLSTSALFAAKKSPSRPNFVIILCDDMGYGDLGCFGNPNILTPNLDRMASEGQRWTNFYVGAPVSTPSRAALMTGRLPVRTGMSSSKRRVLFPDSEGGLPQSELTIATLLKKAGYATGAVGKWHLGHHEEFLPTSHGFDSYYGIPYSNDMSCDRAQALKESGLKGQDVLKYPKSEWFKVPILRDTEEIERPVDQTTLTQRYVNEAKKFIQTNKNRPFFLYLAHNFPHVPLFRSPGFENVSKRGVYGDVIQEIDWSVGEVLQSLKEAGIADNTLVIFTSDNGPWLTYDIFGGENGHLSGGKGGTFDGGLRVPTIFWMGKNLPKGVVTELGATMDLLPTFCALAGAEVPQDRIYDGYDLSATLFQGEKSPREVVYYYRDVDVFAIRKGDFKAHFVTQPEYGPGKPEYHNPPLLFNISQDPGELYNIAGKHPEVIAEMIRLKAEHEKTVAPVVNQLELKTK